MMKKVISLLLAGAISLSVMVPALAADKTLKVYVATNGLDTNAGDSLSAPVATLETARDLVAQRRKSGQKAEVIILEGEYHLDKAFVLGAENSGEANAPIVYRPYQGANVTLTRGHKLDWNNFTLTANIGSEKDMVPESARGKVYQTSLVDISRAASNPNYVKDHSISYAQEDGLFADGEIKDLARWPNQGSGWNDDYFETRTINKEEDANAGDGTWLAFRSTQDTPVVSDTQKWGDTTYVGIWDRSYNISYQVPKSSAQAGSFYCATKEFYKNPNFYVINTLSELDAPGEYYVDYVTQTLYYYPESATPQDIYFMNGGDNAIEINGADHIYFENLKLTANGGTAISIKNSDGVKIYNATITGIGTYAIDANATNLLVAACNISESQEYGIRIQGGNKYNLTASGNEVRNTRIYDYAKTYRTAKPGVYLDGVGVNFHHNEVYNSPHKGIEFQGNDHIIANNKVFDVMMETWDSGAIYTMRSWIGRGTQILDNYIYGNRKNVDFSSVTDDLNKVGRGTNNAAIYVDDMASGITADGNIIYNLSMGALIGGGSDNVFTNNIMIDTRHAVGYDNAGSDESESGAWRIQHITPGAVNSGTVAAEFMDFRSETGKYSNKDAWNKYDGFTDTMAWIDEFDETVASLEQGSDAYMDAVAKLGRVRNRTVANNVVVGDWVRLYNELDGDGQNNHSQHTSFMYFDKAYAKDGETVDDTAAVNMIPKQYNTRELAGVTVTDHEITIDASKVPAGVSLTTADMGVKEDTYVPSTSDDEIDVNSSYRFDVIAAMYDGNGKLQQTDIYNKAYVKDGQNVSVDLAVPENATADWKVKLMLWDKLSGLKPIAKQSIVLD